MDPVGKSAETVGKAIDATREFGKFVDIFVGPPLSEAGGLVADHIRFMRQMNALRYQEKVERERARRGLEDQATKKLSIGQAVPLLEAASMEESDEVQDLFAGRLTSVTDESSGFSYKKVYVSLLREMGPPEATLLDALWRSRLALERMSSLNFKAVESEINKLFEEKWRTIPKCDQDSAISNLRRLECVSFTLGSVNTNGLLQEVRLDRKSFRTSGSDRLYTVDRIRMQNFINSIVDMMNTLSPNSIPKLKSSVPIVSTARIPVGYIAVPELNITLTPLGLDLLSACHGQSLLDESPMKPELNDLPD